MEQVFISSFFILRCAQCFIQDIIWIEKSLSAMSSCKIIDSKDVDVNWNVLGILQIIHHRETLLIILDINPKDNSASIFWDILFVFPPNIHVHITL